MPIGTSISTIDGTAISTSGLIRMGMFRGVSAASIVSGNSYSVNALRFGVAIGSFYFSSDGVTTANSSGTMQSSNTPNWYTPATAGIGTFGSGIEGGTLLAGGWIPLSSSPYAQLSSGTGADAFRTWALEFSTSASGSPIVATGTLDMESINSSL